MVSHNKTGRSRKAGQYVPISYAMAKSPAWRSLGGPAAKVYVELRSRFNGRNNGDLSLSCDEAKRLLHLGKTTVKRAFDELQEKGFIVKTSSGHWYGRKAATWSVTDRKHSNHLATNEWQNWRKKNSFLGPDVEHNGSLRSVSGPQISKARISVPSQDPSEQFGQADGSASGPPIESLTIGEGTQGVKARDWLVVP